jgi:type IV fimbrial biogenesis protein FimT
MKIRAAGFTLIELMVAVAIAAILLAVAMPNFSETLKASRTSSQIRELASGLSIARSEAVARGREVLMCPSSDQATCSGTWSQGWIICSNPDESDDCDDAGDELLRVYQGVGNNRMKVFHYTDAVTSAADTTLRFTRNGTLKTPENPNAVTFVICDAGNDVKFARAALVSTFGRTKLAMVDNGVVAKDTGTQEVVCP